MTRLLLALLLTLGALRAHAASETPVELFDAHGHRTGSALVDQGTGRVDFFDAGGHRTGWGRVDSSGTKVERFGLDGTRQGETVLPVPVAPPRLPPITPKPKS